MTYRVLFISIMIIYLTSNVSIAGELVWPINCIPGESCNSYIGWPDTNSDGKAFNCTHPGYKGHEGTDIVITRKQMLEGVDVYAAADGVVLWVFDGKYDNCPDPSHSDCKNYQVCTEKGNYCDTGSCCCYWCFNGGNVAVIKHNLAGVFATRYDHLKKGSIVVKRGQKVKQGQKIAQAGSAGKSDGPHLHFEVWGKGFYKPVDPWAGKCGPNYNKSLWKYNPPWKSLLNKK